MNLEQIKNEYAVSKGFDNWIDLFSEHIYNIKYPIDGILDHENAIIELIQKECLKLASENSKVLVEGILTEERKTLFTLFDKGVKGVVKRKVTVDKESITNEDNIIK